MVCPADRFRFPGFLRAKTPGVRFDAHSSQVQPVRIPASLDRDVGMRGFVRMPRTSFVQPMKIVISQFEQVSPQRQGEIRSALTMIGVRAFVFPLGIMENGKKLDDLHIGPRRLGEPKTVFQDPCPMSHAVDLLRH